MPKKDYFRILGITRDSSPEDVKRAYRRLAFRYHPDTSRGGPEASKRFRDRFFEFTLFPPGRPPLQE